MATGDIKRSSKRQKRVGDITVKTTTTTTEATFNLEERELESKHSSPVHSTAVSPTSTRTLENQFIELKQEIEEEQKITEITPVKGKKGKQEGGPIPTRRLTRTPPPSTVESKEDTFEFEGSQAEEKEEKKPSKKGRPRKSTGETEKKKSAPKKSATKATTTKKNSVKRTETATLPKRATRPRAASTKAGARIARTAAREATEGTPSEEEATVSPPSPPAPRRTPKKRTVARRLTPKKVATKRKEPEPELEREPEPEPEQQPEQEPEAEVEAGTPVEPEPKLEPEIDQSETIPETPTREEETGGTRVEFVEPEPEPESEGLQESPVEQVPLFPYPLPSPSPPRVMSTPRKRTRASHDEEEEFESEMKTPARKRGRPTAVSSAPQVRPPRTRTRASPDLGMGLFDPAISLGMETYENDDEDEDARQMLEIVQRFRTRQSNSKRVVPATQRFSDQLTSEMKTALHEVSQDQKHQRAVTEKVTTLQHDFMHKTAETLSTMATSFGTQMKSLSNDFKKQNTLLANWQHEGQGPSLAPLHKFATSFENSLLELKRELTTRGRG